MKKIPIAEPDLSGKEKEYLLDALLNEKKISASGKYLDKFEALGKKYFQRKFSLSCTSGTTALHLALLALEIGPGDEVIVPVLTFAATAAVVVHCGAKPVFVDCNKDDWTLDIEELDKKLTKKTKAVIAVDLYGMPCDYDYLINWCKKNKIFLIEDAAEAHGAYYNGKPVGSFGDISCFSFYGNKILTTGEGGMCLTDDLRLYQKMKIFKNHGMKRKGLYEHEVVGYNYRLTNIQAAIGCAQFERFKEFLRKRKKIESLYKSLLSNLDFIYFRNYNKKRVRPACWLFSILIKRNINKAKEILSQGGIDTRRFFKPLHLQNAYRVFSKKQKFPNAEYLYKYGISLPTSVKLNEKDIKYISNIIKKL